MNNKSFDSFLRKVEKNPPLKKDNELSNLLSKINEESIIESILKSWKSKEFWIGTGTSVALSALALSLVVNSSLIKSSDFDSNLNSFSASMYSDDLAAPDFNSDYSFLEK